MNIKSIGSSSSPATQHPDYKIVKPDWTRVRDCVQGESVIKSKEEEYLPRPSGMTGIYASAYDGYLERAHFPQICAYALQGALGVIITKLPEFNVPKELEYILTDATKDGISIQQLFMNVLIEVLKTARCPLLVDIVPETNQFKFVQYQAESFINWKESVTQSEKNLSLAVLVESVPEDPEDVFSHDTEDVYRVLIIDDTESNKRKYSTSLFQENGEEIPDKFTQPNYYGKYLDQIPLFIAGSINNDLDIQPIPLLSIANCSIQIYRKEADLANSEYLSCNPTLVITGANNNDNLPNVVGSSVMIVLPDPAARVFYTKTDTAALNQVKTHISDLYEEAIRHGISILDSRKGVESAEALRIRQATQSATVYSMYLSALNAMKSCLYVMCDWAGLNKEEVTIDAPSSLTFGIPDSNVIREIITGFGSNVIPLNVIHRYLVSSGLIDQTVSYDDYLLLLKKQMAFKQFTEGGTQSKETTSQEVKSIENETPPNKNGDTGESDYLAN